MVSPRRKYLLAIPGTLLVLYGGVGLILDLHLPERILEGAAYWRALFSGQRVPAAPAPVDLPAGLLPIRTHFDQSVLLVWMAWAVGLALLLLAAGRRPGAAPLPRRAPAWRSGLAILALVGVLALGAALRARFLLPLPDGGLPASHYDEMVYLQATWLWTHGIAPYAGYFLAHPPGILIALAPAVLGGTAWGGSAFLVAGRWLQLVYGLAAVALLYEVGRQVGGQRAGRLAALVLAVDVQAVQVAPLETVVNLATVAALWLYTWALRRPAGRLRWALAAAAGAVGVAAALTKAPGVATLGLLGLLALLSWQWRDLLAGAAGAAFAGLAAGLAFVARAPGAFWRQVVAFQLLRPQETTYARNHLARMVDAPESRVTFVLVTTAVVLLAAVALVDAWRRRAPRTGSAVLWAVPLAVVIAALLYLFSYGRAYHARYSVQLIVFLALLVAAGIGALAPHLSAWPRRARLGGGLLVSLALLGLYLPQLYWQIDAAGETEVDRSYSVVGAALGEAVPPGRAVLALDPGYPLLAGRPPARFPDGTYLVDGAGLMIYRAVGVAGMGPRQVWETAGQLSREIDPQAVFHQAAAQDLVVTALYGAGTPPAAAVIDMRIAAEDLTPQTQEFLRTRGPQIAWEQYTAAFAVERVSVLGQSHSGLTLWDFNMRTLSAQGEGPAALPGTPLDVPVAGVLQVSLYWLVAQPPTTTLRVVLELHDGAGRPAARLAEPPHFGDPPTERWEAGWVYQDHHNMPLPADVPPGEYSLHVALVDPAARPFLWDGTGAAAVQIGVVRVQP